MLQRRLAIASSFATLCFINCWTNVAQGQYFYFLRQHPWNGTLFAALLAQISIVIAILAVWPLIRKTALSDWWILIAATVPLAYSVRTLAEWLPFDVYTFRYGPLFWPFALGCGLPVGYLIVRYPEHASRFVRQVLLYAWPVLILVYANAGWQMWIRTSSAEFHDGQLARRVQSDGRANEDRPRVLWIVFDEMSRPATERSAVFRQFSEHGFRALHAQSPAGSTEYSMPSLIQGRIVASTKRMGPHTITLDHEGTFGRIPNLFDTARQMGRNTALAGWYHPYCRILNPSLNGCAWAPGWHQPGSEEVFPGGEGQIISRLLIHARGFPVIGKYLPIEDHQRRHKIEITDWLMTRARQMVRDPEMGLVLLHLPVPHPPHVFDRRRGRISEGSFSYLDSVAQAEQILTGLLEDLRTTGLDRNTTVLISSDHGYRASYWRPSAGWTREDEDFCRDPGVSEIPFLVRLAGDDNGVEVSKPFNTVITRQVIEGILSGRLRTHQQIADLVAAPIPAGS